VNLAVSLPQYQFASYRPSEEEQGNSLGIGLA
jgi:hypothetical protein